MVTRERKRQVDESGAGGGPTCRPIYVKLSSAELAKVLAYARNLLAPGTLVRREPAVKPKATIWVEGFMIVIKPMHKGAYEVSCCTGPDWASCQTIYLSFLDLIEQAMTWGRSAAARNMSIDL